MDIANASLLDESTAAAEAMMMAYKIKKSKQHTFCIQNSCHPQTLSVLKPRANPLGIKIIEVLENKNFPISKLYLIASSKSSGQKINFKDKEHTIIDLEKFDFSKVKIAFFSAGSTIAEKWAPIAAKKTIVIDNSKHFRMDKNVPLVVAEVNPEDLRGHKNIIANPNCSTIQMVVALKPLHDLGKIKRVIVSSYQSTSGAGQAAMDELLEQTKGIYSNNSIEPEIFQTQISFNGIPQIGPFVSSGYTEEEEKMINETKKILIKVFFKLII